MTNGKTLLAEYVENGSETAFRGLAGSYLDLVYSTAVRRLGGDIHQAEDVAQTVFADLARLARTLPKDVMLGGWLHKHTCFVAANTMRGDRRRQSRERQAAQMNALDDHSDDNLARVAPILDEAINQLEEDERTAILLRFFEKRDLRSVGALMGSSENAAQKRIARALEQLRTLLSARGVTLSSAILAIWLGEQAVTAAPVGLALAIPSAIIGRTAIMGATKAIASAVIWKGLVATAVVITVGAGLYETRFSPHPAMSFQSGTKAGQEGKRSEMTGNVRPNPMFSAPKTFQRGLRKISRDPSVEEDLQGLRESKSLTDQDAFLAAQHLMGLGRDELREIIPDLMEIVKENPRSGSQVQMVLNQIAVPPPMRRLMNADDDAGLLIPYFRDSDLRVRQVAAYGVAQILGNEAPPEVLQVTIQGLVSNDEDEIGSSIVMLFNLLRVGEDGGRFHREPASYGTDKQALVTALKEVEKNAANPNWRSDATKLLARLSSGEFGGARDSFQ